MESTIRRNRSTRNNYSRRRKGIFENEKSIAKIFKQILICITIFVVILTIKNIDSTFTSYISNKTNYYLSTDTKFSEIVDSVKNFISGLGITNEKLKSVFNGYGVKIDQIDQEKSIIPDEMKDKIYDHTLLSNIEFAIPTVGVLTSGFGTRINPITNNKEFHNAIDISAKEGEPIRTVLDGVVLGVNRNDSYGNYIKIKHPNSLVSLYAHALSIDVKEGDLLNRGDQIGKVGSTGWANGPHLHFEMWKDSNMINVEKLFKLDTSEVEYN